MNISQNLINLAEAFPEPLYVVGGAVRDFLLGYSVEDIDLASSLTAHEVIDFVNDNMSGFRVAATSPKLGTLKISYGKESYEYTCFRSDSYGSDGRHSPNDVTFIKDVQQDAFRRDFTMNAIYYDIKNDEFLDFSGGIEDMKSKRIRAVRDPDLVLSEDALRIMRLARFAATLGFEIEENTFLSAKKNAYKLKQIAPERLRDELNRILIADTVAGVKNGHVKGLEILVELGAMEYIIPELLEAVGVEQKEQYHKYDVYKHILKVVELSPPEVRLAALFHDIAKPSQKKKTGSMNSHDKEGEKITEYRMNALKYAKKDISITKKLVKNHMYDLNGETSEKRLREFIIENQEIIDDLIKLKRADWGGSGILQGRSPSADRLESVYADMKANNVPFTAKELSITGQDLIDIGIPPANRGKAIKGLLKIGASNYKYHERDYALKFLRNYINS